MTDTSSNISYNKLSKNLSIENGLAPLATSTKSSVAADQWAYNLRAMHALSKANDAPFLAILQPTLGIQGAHDYISPPGSSDRRIEESMSMEYKEMMTELYIEFRKRCSQMNFCFDLSTSIVPRGDFYYDSRHMNKRGNKVLAEKSCEPVQIKNGFFLNKSLFLFDKLLILNSCKLLPIIIT